MRRVVIRNRRHEKQESPEKEVRRKKMDGRMKVEKNKSYINKRNGKSDKINGFLKLLVLLHVVL